MKISGYSFRISILNYCLLGIIASYPIIRFVLDPSAVILKAMIVITIFLGLGFVAYRAFVLIAFSDEKIEVINEWRQPRSKVVLTWRIGWAGPGHFQYDLIRFRVFNTMEKSVAFGYSPDEKKDSCIINFSEGEENHEKFKFDKCRNYVFKTE